MAEQTSKPFRFGSTFAERKAAREAQEAEAEVKAVDAETEEVEDKAVAPKKTASKRRK